MNSNSGFVQNYVPRTIHERSNQILVDSNGLDPLQDTSFDAILGIEMFDVYVVNQAQRGRPDLISYLHYHTTELWWVILVYNNIFHAMEICEGMELQIPNISLISDRLNVARTKKFTTSDVVAI